MGFDLEDLRAKVAHYGRVTRVVIAAIKGSSPREVGAAMVLWDGGQSGTIGGGVLEYQLSLSAQHAPEGPQTHALGPDMGQCCGGAITVWVEHYDAARIAALDAQIIARGPMPQPLAVKRLLAEARNQGITPDAQLCNGWMIEPVAKPSRDLWVWGAGHVGRAIVQVMAPLPDMSVTWVDTGADRFPDDIPQGVTPVVAADMGALVRHAPPHAEHLILTYSHAFDLDLCHRLLGHGFGFAGLIGSKTKWARFRVRLAALGHSDAQIARITCPIGDPSLGKHPQHIAIGVAHALSVVQKPQRHSGTLTA